MRAIAEEIRFGGGLISSDYILHLLSDCSLVSGDIELGRLFDEWMIHEDYGHYFTAISSTHASYPASRQSVCLSICFFPPIQHSSILGHPIRTLSYCWTSAHLQGR